MSKFSQSLIPPILFSMLKRNKYGWSGDYKTWSEAEKKCTGYDAGNILEKVKNALLKVKSGKAVYERDSMLFNEIQYAWPLLACLQQVAIKNDSWLNVLDFGGSLGSTYFQNKGFLSGLKELSWNIVEQQHFVDCGKTHFQDKTLRFYSDIPPCMKEQKPNVLLLSSVMQYLHNPVEWIDKFKKTDCEYIIIDRTAFVKRDTDRITVQVVPPFIYKASYPCRFFSEQKFISAWTDKYEVVCHFDALDVSNLDDTYFKGFFLKRKSHA